jgi:hypothetical protein
MMRINIHHELNMKMASKSSKWNFHYLVVQVVKLINASFV